MRYQTTLDLGYYTDKSTIDGTGVFASQEWEAQQKIGEFEGEFISKKDVKWLVATNRRVHIYEFNGYALHILNDLRYLNHSSNPNTFVRVLGDRIDGACRIEVYALCDIRPGEEMTLNYDKS